MALRRDKGLFGHSADLHGKELAMRLMMCPDANPTFSIP